MRNAAGGSHECRGVCVDGHASAVRQRSTGRMGRSIVVDDVKRHIGIRRGRRARGRDEQHDCQEQRDCGENSAGLSRRNRHLTPRRRELTLSGNDTRRPCQAMRNRWRSGVRRRGPGLRSGSRTPDTRDRRQRRHASFPEPGLRTADSRLCPKVEQRVEQHLEGPVRLSTVLRTEAEHHHMTFAERRVD